jgi:hypothetical protein
VPTGVDGKVSELGATVIAAAPVPLSGNGCGLSAALSVMLREALRVPFQWGVKVTVTVQLVPAATEVPQLLVCLKSLEFVPVTIIDVMVRAAFPGLVSVSVDDVLPFK